MVGTLALAADKGGGINFEELGRKPLNTKDGKSALVATNDMKST